jgi:hypothetical protein
MHPFHEYLTKQLLEHLGRAVVVWYDPRREFEPFVAEFRGGSPPRECAVEMLALGREMVAFCAFAGSFFEVRAAVEPLVALDRPAPLLIYVPGEKRDPLGSLLMELEKAGACYEPQLKRLARNVLRQQHTDGAIDEMLAPESLRYEDVVRLCAPGPDGGQASLLRVVFPEAGDNAGLLAAWLALPETDEALAEKEAGPELFKLIGSRLGLSLEDQSLANARTRTTRFLLVNEWRSALEGPAPSAAAMVPVPETKEQLAFVVQTAARLRQLHARAYEELAVSVEQDLGLSTAGEGSGETFRFEEQAALRRALGLVRERRFDKSLQVVERHGSGFWVQRSLARKAQWEACRLMAELGRRTGQVRTSLDGMGPEPLAWVRAYAADDGWHLADQAQRHLEAWVVRMEEDPEDAAALQRVRQDHDDLLHEMATRFTAALEQAQWHVAGALGQTHVWPEVVEKPGGRTACFFVDALRYEMAAELRRQLPEADAVTLRPAVAALPSITKVGMAALLPGASASFDLVPHKGKAAPRIDGTVLPTLTERLKFLKAKVPGAVDLELHKVLDMRKDRLTAKVAGATLVLVRSQEIDQFGESGSHLARQVMDMVLNDVRRAVRRLAEAGVDQFVITADHGHLFGLERDESMRTDSPGGEELELHRRCWVGRGGSNPPGTVRVAAAELGYASDLDVIFPRGAGVFRAGGDLAYHHGGPSLQELVVPVLCLRVKTRVPAEGPGIEVKLANVPATLTNRTFGVTLTAGGLFAAQPVTVRPLLLCEGVPVGEAGMAFDADLDPTTGCVTLQPGRAASIGLLLKRDDGKKVRVVIQDPASERVLAQSDDIPVNLGI